MTKFNDDMLAASRNVYIYFAAGFNAEIPWWSSLMQKWLDLANRPQLCDILRFDKSAFNTDEAVKLLFQVGLRPAQTLMFF